MKSIFTFIISVIVLSSCVSEENAIKENNFKPIKLKEYSDSENYGLNKRAQIPIGVIGLSEDGEANAKRYLNSLAGPQGEEIQYYFIKKCCGKKVEGTFSSQEDSFIYGVSYKGGKDTVHLILNPNESGKLYIPEGFSAVRN